MNILDRDIFKNCINVMEVNNKVCPIRFSEKQMKFYEAYNDMSMIRTFCPSGICIKGKTNSSYLKLEFSIEKGKCRDWMYFDLFIEDTFLESCSGNALKEGEIQTIVFDLTKYLEDRNGINISLYLPHSTSIAFERISIEEGAFFRKSLNRDKKLMCFGDSITQGMDAKHPSSTYPVLLSNYFNMDLINLGVGGFVFDENSLDENFNYKPDIITVAYGTNDWNRDYTINQFKENCFNYLKKLKTIYSKSKIYVITPFWTLNPNEKKIPGSLYDIIDTVNNVCNILELKVINGFELIPNMCEYFGDGRLHPNDEGFLHIALNLSKKIDLK